MPFRSKNFCHLCRRPLFGHIKAENKLCGGHHEACCWPHMLRGASNMTCASRNMLCALSNKLRGGHHMLCALSNMACCWPHMSCCAAHKLRGGHHEACANLCKVENRYKPCRCRDLIGLSHALPDTLIWPDCQPPEFWSEENLSKIINCFNLTLTQNRANWAKKKQYGSNTLHRETHP